MVSNIPVSPASSAKKKSPAKAKQDYLANAKKAHSPHNLALATAMHREFLKSGDMRNTKWEEYMN